MKPTTEHTQEHPRSHLGGRHVVPAALLIGVILLLGGLVVTAGRAHPTPVGLSPQAAAPVPIDTPISSAARITTAQANGQIDPATALLYRLYSVYDPARLPAGYQAPGPAPGWAARLAATIHRDTTALFASAHRQWGQLPAAVQAALRPFRARPTDPASFWAGQLPTAGSFHPLGLAAPVAAGATFASVDAAHTPIRVWYLRQGGAAAAQQASDLAAEIDRSGMWNTERQVMLGHIPCSDADLSDNGGDGRLDMYVVPAGRSVRRTDTAGNSGALDPSTDGYTEEGVTIPQDSGSDCPSADFILLNSDLEWDELRSTAAHELFHAFQDSFVQTDGADWWDEATATWAEDQIYPAINSEQGQLEPGGWARNSAPDGPLDKFDDNGLAQYGAYIWPFYLTHRPGGSPTLIGQIFAATAEQSPINYMAAQPDWNARFKEFALWNWNWDPVDVYRDNGAHIAPLRQTAQALGDSGTLSLHPARITTDVRLSHASVAYYTLYQIDDGTRPADRVHQVRFDLSGLTGQAGAGVQAIITVDDGTHPVRRYTEDWSGLTEKRFCRDQAAQAVSRVALVVTNSGVKARTTLKGRFTVEAASTCSAAP